MTESIGRIPPHESRAEKSLLGAMLLSNKSVASILSTLEDSDFYLLAHQRIYQAMQAIALEKANIDLITVSAKLGKDCALDAVGGYTYLADISEFVPNINNIGQYAQIVKNLSAKRQLIEAFGLGIEQCFGEDDSEEVAESARKAIRNIVNSNKQSATKHVSYYLEQALQNIEDAHKPDKSTRRIKTCMPDLDFFIPKLLGGQVTVIAATPGTGKSALVLNMIDRISIQQPWVRMSLLSYEMQGDELSERQIAIRGHVDASRMSKGQLHDNEWDRVSKAIDQIATFKLEISHETPKNLMQLRKIIDENSPDLLILDYLQLMDVGHKTESEHLKISEITRELKLMAMEFGIHIILLSQLNRTIASRNQRRPALSDLRGSGSIEENADNVIFIHREDVYRPDETKYDNKAELIIAKQRAGRTGTAHMRFNGSLYLFVDRE